VDELLRAEGGERLMHHFDDPQIELMDERDKLEAVAIELAEEMLTVEYGGDDYYRLEDRKSIVERKLNIVMRNLRELRKGLR
jgi:hypothetical protein